MNMIVASAAMTAVAQSAHAEIMPQPSALADLIETFDAAYAELSAALEASECIEGPKPPPVRILGGQTHPVTLVLHDRTETIPGGDWYFNSDEEIRASLREHLKDAPASEHAAIEKRYAGLLEEYTKQHQANKKASSATRRAEASVMKAHRAEGRALQAILEYEPSTASEALLLLEFASRGEVLTDQQDFLIVIQNATSALRMLHG